MTAPGRAAAAVLATLLLVCCQVGRAQGRHVAPILVRIEGFVGAKPEGLRPRVNWRVSSGRNTYELHVTRLQVMSGNVADFNIITHLRPYRTAFSLAGDRQALEAFGATPAGQQIAITGYLRIDRAARILMVSRVERLGAAATAGPTAPPAAGSTPSPP
jgi:hypothetical protein